MQTPNTRQKPPYLLGLLCLFPLIGAFVGLALLLYGIFKYKDKLLIAIGAFGILFTVAIYSFLFYSVFNNPMFKKGFREISQMQLNSLVHNIEFYKLQHGQYPDSLIQIQKDDQLAPIADALMVSATAKNIYYNYGRVGDRYFLFSSGMDGLPGTKDDFYPQITISDSSRIGLVAPPR
ncbi:hypothetical protein Q4E93_10940 [Flavitalea sp. BT771]|uniref:type II secretion system protein n=1 Tax=Flavitalea sp. BT771 TaxID=3063329 RepID=UPI0026E34BF8|nr:hypothetical protein [Flavitalea sp. BT771]MDO6431107.1 hypothetical protein [Flavitalea sp. BT771]MDV6220014.1 hypothetical protein [Flavitalea sp. BT771]